MGKSIKFKMTSIFILIFIVLAANSMWSVFNFNKLNNSIEEIMESNYASVVAAQNMVVALERQDSAELSHMFADDKNSQEIFLENEKKFLMWLARAEDNITEHGEEEILEGINNLYTQYIERYYSLIEIQSSEGIEEARNYYYNDVLPLFEESKEEARSLQELNQNSMIEQRNEAQRIAENASYSTLLIAFLTILLGLILVFYLMSKIVKPIDNLIDKIKKISEGDYSQQLDVTGDDEISELASEFNIMTEKLKSYELLNVRRLMKEKKKAEAIVESISDGIIVTDEDNKILLVNRAAEKALGIKEKEVINKHFLEEIKEEEIFKIIKSMKEKNKINNIKKNINITLKSGEELKHYNINVKPIRDKDGTNVGMVTLMQDITKLKEVDQMKSDFVSTVSHEFRTPLTSIGMSAGLLLEGISGDITEDQKELLEAIKEDNERLKNLVSDLLDLSRLESGKIQMDIALYDIRKIIQHAVKPFYRQAEDKNTSISINVNDNVSKVKADFNKISWVLTNLVGNALRYTPENGGKIEIEVKETANKILVAVKDNGKGIPEEFQKKIFEKFVQVKDEKGENTGGTGLGLAISKEIVNAHGGDIWIESEPGNGSKFYFTLYIGSKL
ncbi:PAS domain S-box protein [Clostridium sp. D2Q-14]|uniref:ATP-binding protein n=1 Tax=Anaeromonas gelatinilytica TaxID=2683194 RepID=UPI00193BC95F|nr:PAS domain S-box protein [Anaeromonas gelatinilytica]